MGTTHAQAQRTLHLCEYVELSLDDVLAAFGRPDIEEVLKASLQHALGSMGERMTLHAAAVDQMSDSSARVVVDWSTTTRDATPVAGTAVLSLLTVQSGSAPITEVLVALPVAEDVATWVAAAMRRFLDHVTDRLALNADP